MADSVFAGYGTAGVAVLPRSELNGESTESHVRAVLPSALEER